MNGMPFPKPSPAEPLPLEKWLRRTDRAESGREAFFRGRDDEYDVFRSAVMSLNDGVVGGGTMVFQGAPGSGKSALMAECMEAVRSHSTYEDPWVAVSIKPGTLRSVERTVNLLVNAVNSESERLSEEVPDGSTDRFKEILGLGRELSEQGGGIAGFSIGGKQSIVGGQDSTEAPEWVFTEAAPLLKNFRLVVLVDEAQNIKPEIMTQGVIQCLHDPPADIPLVAAFFGLSDTLEMLRRCGLSRFASGRVVNLESLKHEDASSAIRGVFDAYCFAGVKEDRERWVDRFAELSQGWPQHVNRVAVAAAGLILEHEGRIEEGHLEQALSKGREQQKNYYTERLAAGSSRSWIYRELALAAKERGGTLSIDEIEIITESLRGRTSQTLEDFLTSALHAGLLAPTRDIPDVYVIPIPSLGDHLRALDVRTPEDFRN